MLAHEAMLVIRYERDDEAVAKALAQLGPAVLEQLLDALD